MGVHQRVAWAAAAALAAVLLTACGSDSDPGARPEAPASERACGLIDPRLVGQVTGGKTFTNVGSLGEQAKDRQDLLAIGQDDDGSPRQKFDCTVTDRGSHAYLQVGGRSTTGVEDRDAMLATFTKAATGPGCEAREGTPAGYVCTDGPVTTAGLVFDDRWLRITAEPKASSAVGTDLVLQIADDIDANLG